MYDGYATFNGVEVLNAPRLWAYADAGWVPAGVHVDTSLRECPVWLALGRERAYETPVRDPAPWVLPGDDTTLEFTGLVPLGITGLSDSSTTTEVLPKLTLGGTFSLPYQGPKTFGVTVLAVASTDAGMEAGLSWLRRVLHPGANGCDPAVGCTGYALEVLTSCPADDDDDPEDAEACLSDFLRTFRNVRTVSGPTVVEQVGDPDTNDLIMAKVEWVWTAGDPWRYLDTLIAAAGVSSDDFGTPVVADTVTVTDAEDYEKPNILPNGSFESNVSGWQAYSVGSGTVSLSRSTTTAKDGAASARIAVTGATTEAGWRTTGSGINALPVTSRKQHTFAASVRTTTTTSAGTTVGVMRLEWWDADGNLLRTDTQDFSADPRIVINGRPIGSVPRSVESIPRPSMPYVGNFWRNLSYTRTPPRKAETVRATVWLDGAESGVNYYLDDVTLTGPDRCVEETPAARSWAATKCQDFDSPPSAPDVPDVSIGNPKGYTRRTVSIPAPLIGDGPIDLGLELYGEGILTAIRVRVHDLNDLDECAFVHEFTVDYLESGATMTVSGAGVWVSKPGKDTVDGSMLLHGAYDGAYTVPTLGCGRGYRVAVDVPPTFPGSCGDLYTVGDPEGVLIWGVSVTRREV